MAGKCEYLPLRTWPPRPIPLPLSFFFLSLSPPPPDFPPTLSIHPPQVLASLRTVRSNFTILANVTTPTNKSVSYCRTPSFPPLPLVTTPCSVCTVVCWCLSLSLSPMGETFAILINQFMIVRQCSGKCNICIVWHHSSSLCPWLCSQTIEAVNNTKIISLCNAADRRSSAWQALSATSVW